MRRVIGSWFVALCLWTCELQSSRIGVMPNGYLQDRKKKKKENIRLIIN